MKTITSRYLIVIVFFSLTINLVVYGKASSETSLSVDLTGLNVRDLYPNKFDLYNDFVVSEGAVSIVKENSIKSITIDLPDFNVRDLYPNIFDFDNDLGLIKSNWGVSFEKKNGSESSEGDSLGFPSNADLFDSSLEPKELDFKANTYNVQFLTPEWWPFGKEIKDDHWPNSVRRAKEIAEYAISNKNDEGAISCVDFSLLQETINTHRRNEVVQRMNEVCTENEDGSSNGKYRYNAYSLRHHWNGLGDALKAAVGVLDYAYDELTDITNEITDLIDVLSLGSYKLTEIALDKLKEIAVDVTEHAIDLPDGEIVSTTPISHEEISVITNLPVVEINEHEFSVASGEDRFAAKGVLHVRLALGSEKERPVYREPPPVDYCDPTPTHSSGNNPLYEGFSVSDISSIGFKKCSDLDIEYDDETISNRWGQSIDVFVTHLNANRAPHIFQINELLDFIDSHWDRELPMVLAGDFNTRLKDTETDLVNPNFELLCTGLQRLPFKDIVGEVDGRCDLVEYQPSDLEFLTFAREGATNKEGWRLAPDDKPGQIDHVFTMGLTTVPVFTKKYNELPHPQKKIAVWNFSPPTIKPQIPLMIKDIKSLFDGYIEADTFVSKYPGYIRPEDYKRSGDGWRDLEDYIEANIASFDPKGYIKFVDTPDEAKYQILSDHAEIEIDGVVSGERYVPFPAFLRDRLITVNIGTLYAGIKDGWLCGDPDPMGTITLQIGGQEKSKNFGPYKNRSTVNVNESIELIAPAGQATGRLFIDLEEDDAWGCGGDDDLDINPLPNETNVVIDLDFTHIGGITLTGGNDGYSLGRFNERITLLAHPNKLNIKVNIEEFTSE